MGLEYKDSSRCAACGGKCCQLYVKASEGGLMPDEIHLANDREDETLNFDYWYRHTVWHTQKDQFGMEPLYDVLKVNDSFLYHFFDKTDLRKIEGDQYLQDLKAKGIDTGYCAYWTKEKGCIILWANRPAACREWRCQAWIDEK